MKILTITLIAVALLSMTTVAATNQDKLTLGERVTALEKRVTTLESQRWTPLAATNVVGQRVWDRISSCRTPKSIGACSSLDPVLFPFHNPPMPDNVTHKLYREGLWTAQPGGDGDSWVVTATIEVDGRSYGPYAWYVWESNSLIWAKSYYIAMGYGKR
jgi:hypothetical protein